MTAIVLIALMYVGKKPWTFDNVAGSGKAWDGPGDVQEVTVNQARRLLQHPDQWALANQEDAALVSGEVTVQVTEPSGKTVEVPATVLKKPFEKMSKPELAAYAKTELKLDLLPALSKAAMINAIEEALKGPEPMTEGEVA
ncbi:hypothetical protein [Cupriavidus numazuensis]|uniref:Uncharacterized protein n=1 Tax=Cupriavidus numazuensis TaxID=221992 RepID=A0ABN7PWW4_9BURK|nr:hypothetical protein [Cupriavidus numazuensis]CAG2132510.1 hypothetical protein LMG26411_00630 [Cupriavidus numazuensis]